MGSRRCVCGRSTRFPLCDGDHGGADWSCSTGTTVETAVAAIGHLASVGERLAHHLGGVVVDGPLVAQRLILLSDGSDLPGLKRLQSQVQSPRTEALAFDVPGRAIGVALGVPVAEVPAHAPLDLWGAVLDALALPHHRPDARRVFLSHAVADEPRLETVIRYLRDQAGMDIFLCADSIPGGQDWRESILSGLRRSEVVVVVASEASLVSTYCAFEVGCATAWGIPIQPVLLDPSPLPAYLEHLQAVDVPRLLRRRPWLTDDEALLEGLLTGIG